MNIPILTSTKLNSQWSHQFSITVVLPEQPFVITMERYVIGMISHKFYRLVAERVAYGLRSTFCILKGLQTNHVKYRFQRYKAFCHAVRGNPPFLRGGGIAMAGVTLHTQLYYK